jgi:hypothetical protein
MYGWCCFFLCILRGILIGISHCMQFDVHFFHTVASLCFKIVLTFFFNIKISYYVKILWASVGSCCFSSWWWKMSFVSLDGIYCKYIIILIFILSCKNTTSECCQGWKHNSADAVSWRLCWEESRCAGRSQADVSLWGCNHLWLGLSHQNGDQLNHPRCGSNPRRSRSWTMPEMERHCWL